MNCRTKPQPRVQRWLALIFVLGGLLRPEATELAADAGSIEIRAQATYLLNLAHFVDWPTGVFASTNAPIVIGVLGANGLWPTLEQMVPGHRVKGRQFELRRLDTPDSRSDCQIVFLGRDSGLTPASLKPLPGSEHVLMVGETSDFNNQGGMMSLESQDGGVRLKVNPAAVHRAGLRLSAALASVTQLSVAASGGGR